MLSEKPQAPRNKIDLQNATQVRTLKRRLRINDDELRLAVEKVGVSISAVSKEVAARKAPAPLSGTQRVAH